MKLLILDAIGKDQFSVICVNTHRLYILTTARPLVVGNRYDIDPTTDPLRLATLAPARKN